MNIGKNLSARESGFEGPHHKAKGLNHSKQICQRTYFI